MASSCSRLNVASSPPPCTSMNCAGAGHHQVQVHLGVPVLDVVQVEQRARRPTQADADRRHAVAHDSRDRRRASRPAWATCSASTRATNAPLMPRCACRRRPPARRSRSRACARRACRDRPRPAGCGRSAAGSRRCGRRPCRRGRGPCAWRCCRAACRTRRSASPCRCRPGTAAPSASTQQVHRTVVRPMRHSTLPGAWPV